MYERNPTGVCVCTRPSLTQTLRCSWYSLLGAHHTGELLTVVIGTTWQSYSAFCFHIVLDSTITVGVKLEVPIGFCHTIGAVNESYGH